jgi:hypothetical protein
LHGRNNVKNDSFAISSRNVRWNLRAPQKENKKRKGMYIQETKKRAQTAINKEVLIGREEQINRGGENK